MFACLSVWKKKKAAKKNLTAVQEESETAENEAVQEESVAIEEYLR